MKLCKKLLIVFLVVLFSVSFMNAQTPEEVIKKFVDSMGGQKALDSIQTIKYERQFNHTDSGKINRTISYYKRPHFHRWESGDGLGVWLSTETTQWQGQRDAAESPVKWGESKPVHRAPFILDPLGRFLDKRLDVTFEYVGKEKVGNSDAHHIRMIPKKGPKKELYFDVLTGWLVKTTMGNKNSRRGVMVELFSDYRPVKGILFPYKVEATIERPNGKKSHQINTVLNLEINLPLDDALFKAAGKKEPGK